MGNYLLKIRSTVILILFCLCFNCYDIHSASIGESKIKELKADIVFIHNGESSGSGFLIQRQGDHGLIVTN